MINCTKYKADEKNIKYFVRILPLEKSFESCSKIDYENKALYVRRFCKQDKQKFETDKNKSYWCFQTDGIFHETSQEEVYNATTKDLVQKALSGVDCILISYGQTGAGKSFTVGGFRNNWPHRGLLVRLLSDLFSEKISHSKISKINYSLSCVEVHGKKVTDLFNIRVKNSIKINQNDAFKNIKKIQLLNEEDGTKKIFLCETLRSFVKGTSYPMSHLGSTVTTFHVTNKSLITSWAVITKAKIHIIEMAGTSIISHNCNKTATDIGIANLTMTYLWQYFIYLKNKKISINTLLRSSNLLKIIGNEFKITSIIRLIAHIRITEEDFNILMSTLQFGADVTKVKAIKTTYNIIPQTKQIIQDLQNELLSLKKELDLFYMLSDQESLKNISDRRKDEISQYLINYLNDTISDIQLLSVSQIHVLLKIMKNLYTKLKTEKEENQEFYETYENILNVPQTSAIQSSSEFQKTQRMFAN